ncbi:MAG: FtsH protease activity modulator HflK [Elusimicrobia bacterium]|jgi:membrane protease subunit HflK|nr:FtsH protease activity modulator HflK [Elusimicrobiota bacterium]MBK7208559.1 FtsH protease activity modulator HflK [Elusimicrobiota bacterium]MBK7545304.1 FtsH protease activity modulator HflK [Elusimicrobiota bacterium]MBK7575679.1 FtsH protease activity modulator HflK [Elusimicrobiota bacterium]MBK7688585.1 FtsH protease activity modulator HflK [Elusimicrobiota bacterium]
MPTNWNDDDPNLDPVEQMLARLNRMKTVVGVSPKGIGAVVGGLLLLVAAFTSFYTVQPSEEAVVLRFGRYIRTETPGLRFKFPFGIERVIKVKTKIIHQEEFGFRSTGMRGSRTDYSDETFGAESLTLTGDLNVAEVEWIVQYQISDPKKFLFNTREVLQNLRDVTQSVLRRVVGDRLVNEVLTVSRAEIGVEVQRLTQEILDRYDMGIRIVTVKLQDVNPPASVRPAFNEVNSAKQEQEQAINQAEREYNRVIPEARGKAEQVIRDAEGYAAAVVNRAQGESSRFREVLAAYRTAPQVTRTRLYLETLEIIYGRVKSMTIVDKSVEGLLPVFGGTAAAEKKP